MTEEKISPQSLLDRIKELEEERLDEITKLRKALKAREVSFGIPFLDFAYAHVDFEGAEGKAKDYAGLIQRLGKPGNPFLLRKDGDYGKIFKIVGVLGGELDFRVADGKIIVPCEAGHVNIFPGRNERVDGPITIHYEHTGFSGYSFEGLSVHSLHQLRIFSGEDIPREDMKTYQALQALHEKNLRFQAINQIQASN